jgi:hypothetical protein
MIFFSQQEKLGKIIWCECDWKQCWVSASCFNHQTTASQYLLGDTLDFITKAIDSHNINIWSTFYTGSSITHSLNLNPKVELSCSSHRLKQQFPTSSPLMSWHKKVAKVKLPFQAEKVYTPVILWKNFFLIILVTSLNHEPPLCYRQQKVSSEVHNSSTTLRLHSIWGYSLPVFCLINSELVQAN